MTRVNDADDSVFSHVTTLGVVARSGFNSGERKAEVVPAPCSVQLQHVIRDYMNHVRVTCIHSLYTCTSMNCENVVDCKQ